MSKFSKFLKNPYGFINDSPAYQTIKHSFSSHKKISKIRTNFNLESLKHELSTITEIVITKETTFDTTLHIGILKGSAHIVYKYIYSLHKDRKLDVHFRNKKSKCNFGKIELYKFIKHLNVYGEIRCTVGHIKLNISYWVEKKDCYESINDHAIAKRIYKAAYYRTHPFKKGNVFYVSDIFPSEPLSYYNFKIDAVYTWVDHNNKEWQSSYLQYKSKQDSEISDAVSLGRFFNRDELKFSLRSLEQYASWINKIYIVTNCQPPAWLNINNPRIKIIKHHEIMPLESLPTFNSHAIEANIHKIKGLADHFIYLNDDFFFSKDVKKEDFFLSNGVSVSNLEPYGVVNGTVSKDYPDYINAALNGQKLIVDTYNITPTQLHQHSPYALRKDILEEICSLYKEAVIKTTYNRFRSKSDISIPSFLYHHYSFINKQAYLGNIKCCYIGYKKNVNFKKLISNDAKFFCINDNGNSSSDIKWNNRITSFLEKNFRQKSTFEI